ncbi:MAG: hypothetical protein ACOZQL_37135 [Myxococcota bacterium]
MTVEYVPAAHEASALPPVQYAPAGHVWQVAEDAAPVAVEEVPAGHAESALPPVQYEPAGQS